MTFRPKQAVAAGFKLSLSFFYVFCRIVFIRVLIQIESTIKASVEEGLTMLAMLICHPGQHFLTFHNKDLNPC